MIRLISGATQISGRVYRPESGAFEADPSVERNLISRGVAVKVDGSAPAAPTSIPTNPATEEAATEAAEPAPDLTAEVPEAATAKKTPPKKPGAKK